MSIFRRIWTRQLLFDAEECKCLTPTWESLYLLLPSSTMWLPRDEMLLPICCWLSDACTHLDCNCCNIIWVIDFWNMLLNLCYHTERKFVWHGIHKAGQFPSGHTTSHHTTTVLRPFFWDKLGEPVPEENFWTLWCKGRLTEADTLTIRLVATPSGLTSAHLHHPPIFFYGPDALSCRPTNSVKALKATRHNSSKVSKAKTSMYFFVFNSV